MGHYAKRFFGKGEPRDPDFVMTVDTRITASSTVARRYELILKNGDKDVTIDWGDGTINKYTTINTITVGRTYATAGIYQIRIAGSYPGFHRSGNYNNRIVSLDNWGTNEFTDMSLMFAYAKNMIANYTDKPNTSKVTTFRSCFFDSKFSGIVNFDTSNAVSLRGMFYNIQYGALLPQSFAHFNIEKLEPGTDTGLDKFMDTMDNSTPSDMNEPGTTDNYDDTLISFASQNAPNGIIAHFGISKYSDRGKAAREALVAKGWTITDGGIVLPAGYEWATDADFSGTTNGAFRYIGTKQYVAIPHTIKGINVTSYFEMFSGKSIKGVYSDNMNITDMREMFYNSKATSLDLSSFNTSNVTNMGSMFRGSSSQITSLDLSSFDTSNVTNMNYMFWGSKATTGYARTQADADRFNASLNIPSRLRFIVKPQ